MYLTRLNLNRTRIAVLWSSNPYRVHQRLLLGCSNDPRLLFRIEQEEENHDGQILVQSHTLPDWMPAFADFPVLACPPETKSFEPKLTAGMVYRFRILANPTVKKTVMRQDGPTKTRLGLMRENAQLEWLTRKLTDAGAKLVGCSIQPTGFQTSNKGQAKDEGQQTHFGVLFNGELLALDPMKLTTALAMGIGPAKGFGFGLLSLAKG